MKYCLFEGGDVVGPFSAEELLQRKGFGAHSLVCPQEHSEEESYWKAAREYEDFSWKDVTPSEQTTEVPSAEPVSERAEQLVEELNKTLHDLNALEGLDPEELTTPVDQFTETSPNLQQNAISAKGASTAEQEPPLLVTQTVGQASPIEEYFNTMRTGDLGNILGMPDPKANSDMNLARVLEKQFEKTDPVTGGQPMAEGEDPFDEFTPKTKKEASVSTLDEADRKTQAALEQEEIKKSTEEFPPPSTPKEIKTEEKTSDTQKNLPEGSQPVFIKPSDMQKDPTPSPTQKTTNKPKWLIVGLVGIGIIVLMAMISAWVLRTKITTSSPAPVVAKAEEPQPPAPAPTVFKSPDKPVAKPTAVSAAAISAKTPAQQAPAQQASAPTKEDLAKQIVQQYVLDAQRGTIETFLQKKYASQLASGYTAVWSAEPLHKQMYVVKYRLAKTRQEPIVYIFQVDTAKKQLTGALNNITLDLVGKLK